MASESERVFVERPTAPIVPDAFLFAAAPLGLALVAAALDADWIALGFVALAAFVVAFFRNPARRLPGDAHLVVAPADGRVLAVGPIEDDQGRKGLRIGIFLSIFDVHVNRAPVEGVVRSIERGGARYLAAFDRRAERENVRLSMELEIEGGARVHVVQITGWIARRIVCYPQVGERLLRGVRYGLIRFGSRTDVVLPPTAEALVRPGDRVRGGASPIARLAAGGAP